MPHSLDTAPAPRSAIPQNVRTDWLWLTIPIVLYIVLRLPALLHQPGGQDEQFFSVPGWTVLHEGVPRIPYLPTRNRETFFERADRCLMAMPPGLFYLQAPFFAIFPAGYPTSRLPSFVGALVLIVFTYSFARLLGADQLLSLMAATLIALSRALMFTGMIARPELLCILCGVAAMMVLFRSGDWNRLRVPLIVGSLCGLAALFHPFALVFAIQSAAAMALATGSIFMRMRRVCMLGIASVAVLCLWLPLIIAYPHEFTSQFFSNVFDRAGPGLFTRMLWPFPSLTHHAARLLEFAGPWQCGLLSTALVVSSWLISWQTAHRQLKNLLLLTWSSVFLTATVAGIHPTLGYWLYASILIIVLLAATLQTYNLHRFQVYVVWVGCLILCLPGAGLRSSWIYIRHFGDAEYHGQKFISSVLKDLPKEGLFLVDLSYVFDVYLSGRETMLCAERDLYWGDDEIPYDYLLVAWEGRDSGTPNQYNAVGGRLIGSRAQPQSCYVEVYEKPGAR